LLYGENWKENEYVELIALLAGGKRWTSVGIVPKDCYEKPLL
jgi:hypothetical protein